MSTTTRGRLAIGVATAVLGGLAIVLSNALPAAAQDTVRIALPTKTYYPTIISEAALRYKLFEKEGIKAELTVYRGGAEAFEAVAAGAADLTVGSTAIVAAGIKKGVHTQAVAGAGMGYTGWYLMVKPDSPIKDVKDLDGKKVGITSAGSASDIIARWTMADKKIKFTAVPLGGGGLVPNMLSGNVDAIVLYSPLSFKVLQEKTGRALIDYGKAMPEHLSGVWIASDKVIKEKPAMVQKAVNALFGAMAVLKSDKAGAVKLIAEVDEVSPQIAAAELEGNILKLSSDGAMKKEWVQRGLDMAKLVGMKDLAPIDEIYTEKFKAVPTK
ncbi:MAG: ABC transporter substrate-binding protein [Proteobacteria bacterium]|nr:ABC transporter substrate-binding protein [Pseudomonadota bacterium]